MGGPYPEPTMAASPLESEHAGLLAGLDRLIQHLVGFRARLQRGDVAYHQHDLFAERASSLALYVQAAVALAADAMYPPAFAVLRSTLEHQALDHLYFLSARYKRVFKNVSDERLQNWRKQIARRDPGTEDVISVHRVGRNVEVIRSGPHFTEGTRGVDAPSLSIYFGVLDHHDPFEPSAQAQPYLVGDFTSTVDERREHAARHRRRWNDYLAWRRLRENLLLNEFYTDDELVRWDVHHGFLSAFVHPTPRAIEGIYGRNIPAVSPRYDHYASELILLYAHTLARLELEALEAMASREPSVVLAQWDDVMEDMAASRAMNAYFWFPKGDPTMFDRVEEANRRGIMNRQLVPMSERPAPDQIRLEEVRYYKNPLRRLILMHLGINEMTGFAWHSPWPRPDAFTRSMDV